MLPVTEFEKLSRKELLEKAKNRRDYPTYAEKRLRKRLRGKRMLGLSFRFQYVYKNDIFDFYCFPLKVLIEVDYSSGASHNDYYKIRDAKLKAFGVDVLRYKNDEVMDHFNKVMDDIQDRLYKLWRVKKKTKTNVQKLEVQMRQDDPIPAPSPREGKGARAAGGLGSHVYMSREIRYLLIEQARFMRSNPTQAESILWNHLCKKQLGGIKFRRQHIIGAYIVDFYCPMAKLIIEIDGPIHQKQHEYDQFREDDLVAMGYQFLRFTNEEVIRNLSQVIKIILYKL